MKDKYKRISRYEEEIEYLLSELYPMNDKVYTKLINKIKQTIDNRDNHLKDYDKVKENVPAFYMGNEFLIYHIDYIPADLDQFIAYIKKLHIKAVSSKHIDKDALYKLKQEGILSLAEIEMNRRELIYPLDYYYHFDNWKLPKKFDEHMKLEYPKSYLSHFEYVEDIKQVIMGQGNQYDLNYHNDEVFLMIIEEILSMINQGIDIIYLKNIEKIGKRLYTKCNDNEEVYSFIKLIKFIVECVAPYTLILTSSHEEINNYYDYSDLFKESRLESTIYHTIATRNVRLLEKELNHIFKHIDRMPLFYLRDTEALRMQLDYDYLLSQGMKKETHREYLMNYFSGQTWDSNANGKLIEDLDEIHSTSYIEGSLADLIGLSNAKLQNNAYKLKLASKLDILLFGFLLMLPGMVMIHEGEETGTSKLNLDYLSSLYKDKNAYYIYSNYVKLQKIREKFEIFEKRQHQWTFDTGSESVLGIGKYDHGEKILGFFNFSERNVEVEIHEEDNFYDMIEEIPYAKKFPLKPFEMKWLINHEIR